LGQQARRLRQGSSRHSKRKRCAIFDAWEERAEFMGVGKMGGWSRIGVVLSVLWAVGMPAYLAIGAQDSVNSVFQSCMSLVYNANWPAEQEKQRLAQCTANYATEFKKVTFQQVYSDVYSNKDNVGLLVWIPILGLWIMGGVLIGTLRWVAQGFSR
jgi:hypothetical protein